MIDTNEGINDSAAAELIIRSRSDREVGMRRLVRFVAGGFVAAAVMVSGACGSDEPTGPEVGTLEVLLTMEGTDQDPNGGSLVFNGEVVGALPVDVRISLEDIEAGIHVISVSGINPNCAILGVIERNVTVRAGQLASEEFRFLCEPTGGKNPGGGVD